MTGTARLASREGTAAGPSLAAALTSSSILTNQHPQASHVLTKSECQRVFWSCCAIWQPQGEKVSSHFHLLFPACQEVESFLFLAIEVLWLWCTCSHPSPTRPLSCCFSVYIDWIQSFCWMYCKQSPGVSFLFFFCLWQTSVPAEARKQLTQVKLAFWDWQPLLATSQLPPHAKMEASVLDLLTFFSGGAGAGNLNFYGENSELFVCLFSLLSFLFWGRVLGSPGWLWTHCVVESNLDFLNFLFLPP